MSSQSTSDGGLGLKEVTRNELRTLRNRSELEIGCTYSITNYSRGCLTTDSIFVTPLDVDKLNKRVNIIAVGQKAIWDGVYDIDANRVIQVYDHLGNTVGGRYGNEVDRFPWGLTNVHSNICINADTYMDCDTTQNINSNTWIGRSYTDLRGFEGTYEANSSDAYGRVYLNGATTVDYRRNKHESFTYNYFSGGVDDLFIRQNSFTSSSYVRSYITKTGRTTIQNSRIGRGDFRHSNGVAYLDNVEMNAGGRLYAYSAGRVDARTFTFGNSSLVINQNSNAASITRYWRGGIINYGLHYIRTAVTGQTLYFYNYKLEQGTFDYRSGSATISSTSAGQQANGYIRIDNAEGSIRLNSSQANARADILLNGVSGATLIDYISASNYIARISFTNTLNARVQYSSMAAYGQINATGGSPLVLYCDFDSIGILTMTNYTGTVQRSKIMSDARVNLVNSGNIYASTFGTSYVFNGNGFAHSYVTCFGNRTHTAAAANINRGDFHNLVNNLL